MKKFTKVMTIFTVIASLMTGVSLAAIPPGTVIVGSNAYHVDYLNENSDAIMDLIMASGDPSKDIYIKVADSLILDMDGAMVDSGDVPSVTYYSADGESTQYGEGDGDPVSNGFSIADVY